MIIEFFVPGVPATAGSKVGIAIYKGKGADREFTGKVNVKDSCKKKTTWMADVKHFAYQQFHREPPLLGPLRLDLVFTMPRPAYHFVGNKKTNPLRDDAPTYHDKTPDVLKLARAVEDALSGVVYGDDKQIADEHLSKVYGANTGAMIRIETL